MTREGDLHAEVEELTPTETHSLSYDSSYRVSSNTQATRGTLGYTYTADDRPATAATTSGPTATYTYYADGSLNTLVWSPVSSQFKYTYNLTGQYNQVTFPNGQTRNYGYDDQGRLLQLGNVLGATNLATYAYGYDVDNATGLSTMLGQRTSLTASVPAQNFTNALTKYYYDSLYQLARANYPTAAPFNSEVDSWTYDAIGNRLTNTVNGSPQTYTYVKNGANPLNGQRLSNDGVNAYTWDSNGSNLTRNGVPGNFTFGYSVDNRLNSISGAATATYAYDYKGRRTSKTVGGTTTTYLYDGLNLVGETTAVATTNYAFGPGIDEPLVVNKAGTISYFNTDGLGSVTGTNSAAGTFDYNSVFDAWGTIRSETGARTSSFTYTGRETGEGGLQFYRARFLDPARGRFTQEDPLGVDRSGDVNMYRYALNMPIIAKDPTGLFTVDGSCDCLGRNGGNPNGWQQLVRHVTMACRALHFITDPKLRACIEKSCDQGTIECRNCPPGKYAHNDFIFVTNRTTSICSNNWQGFLEQHVGGILIHEWAHGCGWKHGQGGDVPFPTGEGGD